MNKRRLLQILGIGALALTVSAFIQSQETHIGKQSDGTFIVSSGQKILPGTISFKGRPSDLAMHPNGSVFAVLNKGSVFLCKTDGVVPDSSVELGAEAGFRGIAWTPDGSRLIVSTAAGYLQSFDFDGKSLTKGAAIKLSDDDQNPVPGGMAITRDGKTLYVSAGDLNAVVQVDLATNKAVKKYPTENLPFEVKLTPDESHLVATNWGGRLPKPGDSTEPSEKTQIVVDGKGAAGTGSVTVVDLASGSSTNIPVGIHPTDVAFYQGAAYIANAMSDTISELDLTSSKIVRTIALSWGDEKLFGCMPVALAINGGKLFACDGGDNAVAQIDLTSGKVEGFRPAGYYPIAMTIAGNQAIVLNSKGNGSVARTAHGGPLGNAHDFEGTISVVDLGKDLASETSIVAKNDGWDQARIRPKLAVYNGAIQHVLYIIKENRTYDEVFGDMPEGNGDKKLCDIGETLSPNQHALAREFTLFDNGYVSGTNSCDGHAWSTQSLADDYIEHFYVGYSRTYNDDGNCAMSLSTSGCIWDAAAKKHKSIRVYGEYCVADNAEYKPYRPKDWFEAWKDREEGTHKFHYIPHALYTSLKPYVCPAVHYWPLIQSDQARADEFIKEYGSYSHADKVPNLMVFALPCDHTEGMNPEYPAPKSMIADNDLALGRIVDVISHSPQWKNTCIFVIEDDAQSGPDHVDGHRTAYQVFSPYIRRHTVDSTLYTTTNMLRSIEMMLRLDPMNRFDALARPIDTCFQDTPDLTAFDVRPNRIALNLTNPARSAQMSDADRYWTEKNQSLDWSHLDWPNNYWLNRIIWYSLHEDGTPYPGRAGETPDRDENE